MLKLSRHYNGLSQCFSRRRYSPGVRIPVRANIKPAFESDLRPGVPADAAVRFFAPTASWEASITRSEGDDLCISSRQ